MGKIRVKTFDETEQAEKDKKLEARREAKKHEKKQGKVPGMGGGERITTVGPTEEELEAAAPTPETGEEKEEGKKKKKAKFVKHRVHGKKYVSNLSQIDKKTTYSLNKALSMLKGFQASKFDETVELHINVKEKGLSGTLVLPHGTGKVRKIKVVDDAIIAEIESGKITFDVLVATPQMMPKLAKVAKILGPRGLMPNPKSGTVTPNPDEIVGKLQGGQVNYKTEPSAPLIHMTVGKVSFGEEKLQENIQEAVKAIKSSNIVAVTLKSTMSPGIKIQV